MRGIDEKFQVSPATGTGALALPIATSPARQGFGPQLTLRYDSGSGSGPFGLGWRLSLPRITRKTDKGLPTYRDGEEADVFILSEAEDLVPVLVEDGDGPVRRSQIRILDETPYVVRRYRPRIEGLFARVEHWIDQQSGGSHWRTITPDNITSIYGRASESRIVDPKDPLRIFCWLICESFDDKGNAIVYRYKTEDSVGVSPSHAHERNRTDLSRTANRYIKRILYGNRTPRQVDERLSERSDWMFEAVFDYGEGHLQRLDDDDAGRRFVQANIAEQALWPVRQDPISTYRAGFEVRTYRLCRRVLMFHHFPDELGAADYLVRATHFGYSESPISTVMSNVVQSGYLLRDGSVFQERSLPPVEFEYSRADIQSEIYDIDPDSLENLPVGLSGSQYRWVDLDGEGVSGILTQQGGGWYYKANLGNARFASVETVTAKPSLAAVNSGPQLLDLAGDGQLDWVLFDGPAPGFHERTHDRTWADHRAFASLPAIAWDDPHLRFIDLTGDGHADIMITEDQVFTWYPSLAEAGYDAGRRMPQALDEEAGPRLVFADAAQSVYLADMSGDGLSDLVRIRNGSIGYWPNFGYGRFGAKVNMDNAPWFDTPDGFNQQRIRLADVDGSGISDILYIHHDKISVYFNRAGNGWDGARFIDPFPRVDTLSDVTVTDLLGNGTACLVWSSPLPGDAGRQMRYIDLMGGIKPHLMIVSRNHMGAETRVQYTPSTRFYLEDKAAGRPWITRLPFPVHVVERTETFDPISRNRFVTRYAYHHGYFDGVEREFRGFGMVEQFDTEEFAVLNESDNFPTGDNIDARSHIPPVHTKTWLHTGIYLGHQRVSNYFAGLIDESDTGEYFREPGLSDEAAARLLLPDTVLPEGLNAEEEREACRALKGAVLRQEIYALDGTAKAPLPYTVMEQNYTIRILQPKTGNRHAVFYTHARETLNYHYEREPADPRISHALTLAVDDFGNVLQSAAIAYGRRQPDPDLRPDDRQKQAQLRMTCAENTFTHPVDEDDAYRSPLPSERLSFELTGLSLGTDQIRFSFSQMHAAVRAAETIAYHHSPTEGLQKRILEHARIRYRPDDLGAVAGNPDALLPLGVLQTLALPGESYILAFTPDHLERVYGERVNERMLSDEGRYVHFDGDENWWIPSGRSFLSPSEADGPARELAFARQHFFLSRRIRDPFLQTAIVAYDPHDLMMTSTVDALENRVTVRNDYRVLAPDQLTDPNGNRSAAVYDILGLVAGTAVMGKETENLGDPLDGFQPQLTQGQIDRFFANPRGPMAVQLLGSATTRIIYDETRFQRFGQPSFAATIARETHVSDLSDGEESAVQVSLAYADGFGRVIQNKVQAEPGPVPLRDADDHIILGPDGQPEFTETNVSPRWVGSGWTVFNNKGSPIRQYEPFFTDRHGFEFDARVGVSPTIFYDPVGRAVVTLHPNHTWEKVVFNPWRQGRWDVSDTVLVADPAEDPDVGPYFQRIENATYLPTWHQARIDGQLGRPEQDAAQKAAAHAATPAIVHFDALGRPFLSIADNGPDGQYETRTEQDIEGVPLRVVDARGNAVMVYRIEPDDPTATPVIGYDVAGRQLFEHSMDGGDRRMLLDIAGQPIRQWDARGHRFRFEYDELRRPLNAFVAGGAVDDAEQLFQRTVYGESEGVALNHRGQVYQLFDQAGVVTNIEYDFKGNLLRGTRQFTTDYRNLVDWSQNPAREDETFVNHTTYDALNRPTTLTSPDASITLPGYNEAGLLERMAVRLQGAETVMLFVDNIDYNARGQRERIDYATADGRNLTTTYDYDPETFRLMNLRTQRHRDGRILQDLYYAYDPAGNITTIRDNAQQTVFFANSQVEPHNDYTYDPLYRLIHATGREHAAQHNHQRDAADSDWLTGIPFPNNPEALQRYEEQYAYDQVGNILSMAHTGGAVLRWKRCYQYAQDSNRLLATGGANEIDPADPCPSHYVNTPSLSQPYEYDVHGNMTSMPHLPSLQWDFQDRLRATRRTAVANGGSAQTTYYVYDAGGRRVRKVTERQAAAGRTPTRQHERIYLGGFETYREYAIDGQTPALERQTLHVTDSQQRVAQIDTRTVGNDNMPEQSRRFQLGNHLGSVALEIDENANVISFEEYHPYGTTACRAGRSAAETSLKRYRYTGKERDEATGLYYHGARYYACWLGRWMTIDPIGVQGGINVYLYVNNQPINFIDKNGENATDSINPVIAFALLKWRKNEVELARKTLAKSDIFNDLGGKTINIRSYSKREEYLLLLESFANKAHENTVKKEKELGRTLNVGEMQETIQKTLRFEDLLTRMDGPSYDMSFRLLSFPEWLPTYRARLREARADMDTNEVYLYTKKGDETDLTKTVAHETSHFFDPMRNVEISDTAATTFAENRTELFAEIFSEFILAETRGQTSVRIETLRYASETVQLTREEQKRLNAIYQSKHTSEEKAEEVNRFVVEQVGGVP
ncbi:hypothetical protein JCM12296A_23080 [Desulfosarcina cetonica]